MLYLFFREIFFIAFVVTLTLTASTPPPIFYCLAAYAKLKGITDPAFEMVDYDSSREECVLMRHKFISDIRKEIRSKINEAEILPKYSACIYEKLTGSESFVSSMIKAAALEYSGSSQESGRLNNTVDMVLEYIKATVVSCKGETDLAGEFDALFETQMKLEKNDVTRAEEYCIKKYLIKNNLIDTELYNVDPNPHKINVTGLNCEAMIRKSNDEIYEELGFVYLETINAEKVECALEKFRQADYFDLMMKITALTTVNITPEQKLNERDNFVRILSRISENISTC